MRARIIQSLSLATLALAVSIPAMAQDATTSPMTAQAFDDYTTGRTLSYNVQGTPYGVEQYLPNRRVRWTFIGEQCQDGVWYERNGNICFLYDNAPADEQCWTFLRTENGLHAIFQGPDGPSTEIYEVEQNDAPMSCLGPGVGV